MSGPRLYLANVDPELFPLRAVAVLENAGWRCAGNYYDSKTSIEAFRPDVLVYVPTRRPDATKISFDKTPERTLVLTWVLYPDQLIGWDVENCCHGSQLDDNIKLLFQRSARVVANSRFTQQLLRSLVPYVPIDVCLLGIDSHRIEKTLGRRPPNQRRPASVLWQHRWSADKNLTQALDIILNLARVNPHITFYLGRAKDWQPCYVPDSLREDYVRFALAACAMPNVKLIPRFDTQKQFWQFLRHVDVGFSTAYHETFGLSMLEQAFAGAACVVPDHAAYPEIHRGALVLPLHRIIHGVQSLLQDFGAWQRWATSSQMNAARYDVEHSAKQMLNIIESLCN